MQSESVSKLMAIFDECKIVKKKKIEEAYRRRMHKELNFNNIQTFNEKMQWLKLYYRDYKVVLCADKLHAKTYLRQHGLGNYVPKTLAIYHSTKDINYDKLPNKFVIKTTHGSGYVIVCIDKEALDCKKANEMLDRWLEIKYGAITHEWFYDVLKPRIFVEEYLEDAENAMPIDYKFLCFNGKCKLIFTVKNRELKRDMYMDFYDRDWNKLPFGRLYHTSRDGVKKPDRLEEMLEIAESLAVDFPFVRIDFFLCNGRLYIGEMTFIPGNGHEAFRPSRYDGIYGAELELPDKKYLRRKKIEYLRFRHFCKKRNILRN